MNPKPQQVIQSIKRLWDCSLISNKNFSEILPSNGLDPGPGEVGQGGLKVLHLWRHSQKIRAPQPKIVFFQCRLEDLLHLLSLWTALYRFWRQSYARAKLRAIRLFWHENPRTVPDVKVLNWLNSATSAKLSDLIYLLCPKIVFNSECSESTPGFAWFWQILQWSVATPHQVPNPLRMFVGSPQMSILHT